MSWKGELDGIDGTFPTDWPDDAGETLLAILRDPKAEEAGRQRAAELAGDAGIIGDELADALLSIVQNSDEPASLRAASAIALGPALEMADMERFEDDFEELSISEETFRRIQKSLQQLYNDNGVPKLVRRRVLEAAVRAPQDWHAEAVREAYASKDEDWKLTAVFSMGLIPGFEDQILESLKSGNPEIYCEAVRAAGNQELAAAWPHVAALLTSGDAEKGLLLAAIDAAPGLRPDEAGVLLADLIDSDDEEIAEAAQEALSLAEALADAGDLELDDDEDDPK
jgi:uncharacterized protein (UPF0147 family)